MLFRSTASTNEAIPSSYGGMVRKLAELVRAIPEPEVSWASLYAVKEAGYRTPAPLVEVNDSDEGEGRGAPLRKMANEIRNFENLRAASLFEKSANALKAIRGLTLLRERMTP